MSGARTQCWTRVKENVIFLRNPEAIEETGGYVPGGILLWGPPGTGKTLMAEAVAGETRNPFVFVDPAPSRTCSWAWGSQGAGLFRKLRRWRCDTAVWSSSSTRPTRWATVASSPVAPVRSTRAVHRSFLTEVATVPPISPKTPCPSCSTAVCTIRAGHRLAGPDVRFSQLEGREPWGRAWGGWAPCRPCCRRCPASRSRADSSTGWSGGRSGYAVPKPPPNYRILIMMATNLPQALDEGSCRGPAVSTASTRSPIPPRRGGFGPMRGYLNKIPHQLTPDETTSWRS